MNTSLYRNTQLYIKANLIDLSDLVIINLISRSTHLSNVWRFKKNGDKSTTTYHSKKKGEGDHLDS